MAKIDFKKELKHLYRPSAKEVVLVEVPAMNFLMIDGRGDPNTATEYVNAVEALYSVSYTLKFSLKHTGIEPDYTVMPLEGLWWVPDMNDWLASSWDDRLWTAMIMQPAHITKTQVEQAIADAGSKKELPSLKKLRFEQYEEALAAQTLYFGPYSDEGPTIERIHEFITANGYSRRGKHHEIYLSDPRRTAPEKLKTIIRQPVG